MSESRALSLADQQKLEQWVSAYGTPQQVALRCRLVLATSDGESDVAVSKRLAVNRNTVILWRKRFAMEGLNGLWDIAPGRGRKPEYSIDKIAAIVDATLQTKNDGGWGLERELQGELNGTNVACELRRTRMTR